MFTLFADSAIAGVNYIQSSKKEWTKRFVQDEKIAESFNNFVDAQTDFVKQSIKAWETVSIAASKELGKFPKFDLAK